MNEAAKSNANVADYNFSEEKYIDEFHQPANGHSWMALHAALKLKENSINPLLIKAGKRRSPASLMAEKGAAHCCGYVNMAAFAKTSAFSAKWHLCAWRIIIWKKSAQIDLKNSVI